MQAGAEANISAQTDWFLVVTDPHQESASRKNSIYVFRRLRRQLAELLDSPDSPTYEYDSILIAATAHAEIFRVHLFQDDNGRTSRLIMDWILVKLGLRPIPVEACKEEYYLVMNHYMVQHDPEPLLDSYLRLYITP